MREVEYSQENVDKCWCGSCPVQSHSQCARDLFATAQRGENGLPEDPAQLAGLYCSTGKTVCDDVNFVNLCHCPACLVWSEHELASNHYCLHGSAEEVGR